MARLGETAPTCWRQRWSWICCIKRWHKGQSSEGTSPRDPPKVASVVGFICVGDSWGESMGGSASGRMAVVDNGGEMSVEDTRVGASGSVGGEGRSVKDMGE